jgi:hypothetical protein
MSDDTYLSDEALLNLINALADEVIELGGAEAELIITAELSDKDLELLIKTNTLLTAFASLLVRIVQNESTEFAREVINVWTSDSVQELVRYAFKKEIDSAVASIAKQIDDIETIINNSKE